MIFLAIRQLMYATQLCSHGKIYDYHVGVSLWNQISEDDEESFPILCNTYKKRYKEEEKKLKSVCSKKVAQLSLMRPHKMVILDLRESDDGNTSVVATSFGYIPDALDVEEAKFDWNGVVDVYEKVDGHLFQDTLPF
eukprot:TRINITY_DN5798_c0_g2_i1.p1 TRINITY_DN5798_c0_g2~~TRINITY_DN5798_c0_g2_i1.p1  ORF type:complete len:137 (-),score=33.82 TRINITY_DN5798_c0_g2_i1:414-824(-)